MPYCQVKELPRSLQAALDELNYHRADIEVRASETAHAGSASGDGYRAFDVVVDLATGARRVRWGSWGGGNPFQPNNPVDNDQREQPIPAGAAVINGSIGGGRPVWAYVTVHPDNMARLLPSAPEGSVTDRDLWILWTFKGLNSRGRREEWMRYRQVRPSEAELDHLAEQGLLKRSSNGATKITAPGRNVVEERCGRFGQAKYAPPGNGSGGETL